MPRFTKKTAKPSTTVVKYVKKTIKRALNSTIENKYFYGNYIPLLNNTYANYALMDITQNTVDTSRIGDELMIKEVRLNYWVRAVALTSIGTMVRIVIIQWHENIASGSVPSATFVFQDATSTASVMTIMNHDRKQLCTVLYDKCHTVTGTAGNGSDAHCGVNIVIPAHKYRKRVSYIGASADGINKLFLYAASSDNSVSGPILNATVAITYLDA